MPCPPCPRAGTGGWEFEQAASVQLVLAAAQIFGQQLSHETTSAGAVVVQGPPPRRVHLRAAGGGHQGLRHRVRGRLPDEREVAIKRDDLWAPCAPVPGEGKRVPIGAGVPAPARPQAASSAWVGYCKGERRAVASVRVLNTCCQTERPCVHARDYPPRIQPAGLST